MPQLRSGVRRGRPAKKPITVTDPDPAVNVAGAEPEGKIKKKGVRAVRGRPRRNGTGQNGRKKADENVLKTTPLRIEEEKEEEAVRVLEDKEDMDEFDSGGQSGGDKALEAEDEGTTTPIPERVFILL